ncbi:Succinyl-CoA ligase [ADP-forming] beta chain [Crocosphaera watsonii WH 0005]|uniref:Succinyl-CoA ligase [ADP-forming] beta chain n=1 Tax=Crocosphaera watsonii WH 0005 TaxID=423472 RepID=T2IZC3_CROWT|nr:Succinyl-CoA ligase [ADP-forming] beta chain [Crocosphaera watsonii WH 0005]
MIKQLGIAIEKMLTVPDIKVIFINIVTKHQTSELVAQALLDYCQPLVVTSGSEERLPRPTGSNSTRQRPITPSPMENPIEWVIRLPVDDLQPIEESFSGLSVNCFKEMMEAVKKTVALSSQASKRKS